MLGAVLQVGFVFLELLDLHFREMTLASVERVD